MVVFYVKSNENTYPKGRALMHISRVVHITKRGNRVLFAVLQVQRTNTQVHLYNKQSY